MQIGVVQFPGSHCQRETKMAIERAGMGRQDIFWHAEQAQLDDCDGFVIVGGFSYQDRIRSGVIAAQSPLMAMLIKQNQQYHKPVLGICNGAQILVESGLVPGLPGLPVSMALYDNQWSNSVSSGFYNDIATIKPSAVSKAHAFTNAFNEEEAIAIPFAHAQGCFKVPQPLLDAMNNAGLPLFQYHDMNPNGSDHDLAAVTNFAGNVMAMMPHPERCPAGDNIFHSMRQYIKSKPTSVAKPPASLKLTQPTSFASWQPATNEDEHVFFVELMIEDNEASTLQLFLKQQGFEVSVKKTTWWQVNSPEDRQTVLAQLDATGECFNRHKENVLTVEQFKKAALNYMVKDKFDQQLKAKQRHLLNTFNLDVKLQARGQVYSFNAENKEQLISLSDFLSTNHILFNPYVQDCYDY